MMSWKLIVVALMIGTFGLGIENSIARADVNDPRLGGCIVKNLDGTCKLSAHPTLVAPLTAVNLSNGKIHYGIEAVGLGACYGVTYQPGLWYSSGASFCLNVNGGDGLSTQVMPSGVLHLVNWGAVGVGGKCIEGIGCDLMVLFGVNVPVQ